MSGPQRPIYRAEISDDSDGDEAPRPALPPQPSAPASELLLPLSETQKPSYFLSRKSVIPKRFSRDARSYSPVRMRELQDLSPKKPDTKNPSDLSKDAKPKKPLESGHLPPKAFHKTHLFLGLNLGYWRMPARQYANTFSDCYANCTPEIKEWNKTWTIQILPRPLLTSPQVGQFL